MRNLVVIVIFSLSTPSLLCKAEADPQQNRYNSGGFSSLYWNRNQQSFNPLPPPPPPPPPFSSFRGQSGFERVPKFDVIQNLELPRVEAEKDSITAAPHTEFSSLHKKRNQQSFNFENDFNTLPPPPPPPPPPFQQSFDSGNDFNPHARFQQSFNSENDFNPPPPPPPTFQQSFNFENDFNPSPPPPPHFQQSFNAEDNFRPSPPPFRSFRGQKEFSRVPKFDLIQNLELPLDDAEQNSNTEAPLKEFEYVPPTYETNRDPPYNVILLTVPRDDAIVNKDTTERVPSIKDPRYTKFRPTRLNAFGSELIYLQSRDEIEKERRRGLEGSK